MNVLPKGILPVVMATATASVLILAFGETSADSGENASTNVVIEAIAENKVDSRKVSVSESTNQVMSVDTSDARKALISPPPPPGPFLFNGSASSVGVSDTSSSLQQSASSAGAVEVSAPSPDSIQGLQQAVPVNTSKKPENLTPAVVPKLAQPKPSTPVSPVTSVQAPSFDKPEIAEPKEPAELVLKNIKKEEPMRPVNKLTAPKAVVKPLVAIQTPNAKFPKLVGQKPSEPSPPVANLKEPEIQKIAVQETKGQLAPAKADVVMTPPVSPEQIQTQALSEPILNVKRPKNLSVQLEKPKMQVQSRQAPTSNWKNSARWMPQMPQQYMYVPMPVYNSGFVYPPMPMNNNHYFVPNSYYGAPATFMGGNSQVGTQGVQTPNVEIK